MTFRSSIMDYLFSDEYMVSKYLHVEVNLAKVQAELGVIPKGVDKTIASIALLSNIDMCRYRRDFDRIGFPIVGLLEQINEKLPEDLNGYLHWGATTQDIMDTGLVLTLKEVVEIYCEEINGLISQLADKAKKHKNTMMVGRSQLQHGIPITFGYKVVVWIAPLKRHLNRLKQLKARLGQLQFGGAMGTMAALGEVGFSVRERLADALDLENPILSWHTQRDNLMEFMSLIGSLSGSISKIAQDILFMTQSEVSEITEKSNGKSSTMPNKNNPINTQKVLVACKLARGDLQLMNEAMVQEHERGSGTWQIEWQLIPSIVSHTFYALNMLNSMFRNVIEINGKNMIKNLNLSETVYAEGLMMALAPFIGRQKAHHLVDTTLIQTGDQGSFKQTVFTIKEITNVLSKEKIEKVFSGKIHMEMAEELTKRFLDDLDANNKFEG
ncbi:class-II fumarase/aspartase family protein [Flagellimonas sp. 2504JD4-2]